MTVAGQAVKLAILDAIFKRQNHRTTVLDCRLSFESSSFLQFSHANFTFDWVGDRIGLGDKMRQDRERRLPAAIITFNANAVTANHSGEQQSPPDIRLSSRH